LLLFLLSKSSPFSFPGSTDHLPAKEDLQFNKKVTHNE